MGIPPLWSALFFLKKDQLLSKTEKDDHEEEEGRPQGWYAHVNHCLWNCYKGQIQPHCHHVVECHPLYISQKTKGGKNEYGREKMNSSVDAEYNGNILDEAILSLVKAPQRDECHGAQALVEDNFCQ